MTIRTYRCPECKVEGRPGEFERDDSDEEDGEVSCEDCGSHGAYRCPHCGTLVDRVMVTV